MNTQILEVTQRIIERSKETRRAYLEKISIVNMRILIYMIYAMCVKE